MGASPFNFGSSNNAPPPIPGGYGNPTGANTGGITPSANKGIFGPGDFSHLSTGFDFGGNDANFSKLLGKSYGIGTGSALNNIFTNGLFNPQVAASLLNSLQPGIARGQADILNAFGAGGNRFSSSAALGLGDYNSQVQLNEGNILSQLFQTDQAEQLGLLNTILPTLHDERANSGGFWGDLLGGLEAVGGAIAAPFTGGATIPLIGAGIGTIAASNSGGGKGGGGQNAAGNALQALLSKIINPNPTSGIDQSTLQAPQGSFDSILQQLAQSNLESSAGAVFGGSDDSHNGVPWK